MTIEFRCSHCGQLLRVPEGSAGKTARCPKCQSLLVVPASGATNAGTGALLPPESEPGRLATMGSAAGGTPPPGEPPSPFAEGGGNFFGERPASSSNPYASPSAPIAQPGAMPIGAAPIRPQAVAADTVFNHAWEIWKSNLALLVGVTVTVVVASYLVAMPFSGMQMIFQQNGDEQTAAAIFLFGQLVSQLVQIYLGIGQAQIALKLARWQPAKYSDLFGGMPQFLPVLGGWFIATVALSIGLMLCLVPGILMLLAFWPFYYLLVDQRAGVIESFSIAGTITSGNWGTAFVLWAMSVGIMALGSVV
jgi:phage FluMu protein Com